MKEKANPWVIVMLSILLNYMSGSAAFRQTRRVGSKTNDISGGEENISRYPKADGGLFGLRC
ncbi:MAG: hypothetical protein WC749_15020 [Dehalococcoidia bacterium]